MSIDVKWEREDGISIAVLAGSINSSNADEFHNSLESGIDSKDRALILDFGKVTFISSAGLRVILVVAKKFRNMGKEFAICTLSDPVHEITAISGFDRIISVYASRNAAVEAVQAEIGSPGDAQEPESGRAITIRRSVDLNIVGDNIRDIADFTVEKYEFRNNRTLSAEIREEAIAGIKDALWQQVEKLKLRRRQILEAMFNAAETKLQEVVDKQQ